jgi:hypothetical protein
MNNCAACHQGPSSAGIARRVAPFRWRQKMAAMVRRSSFGGVWPRGRTASIPGGPLAILGVAQYAAKPQAPGAQAADLVECDPPLGAALNYVRHACGPAALRIFGPGVRQEQPQSDDRHLAARQVQGHQRLAVRPPGQTGCSSAAARLRSAGPADQRRVVYNQHGAGATDQMVGLLG